MGHGKWLNGAASIGALLALAGCSDSSSSDNNEMTDDAGISDSGTSEDSEKVPFTAGDAISSADAADMTWTYVGFPDTKCRDGSSTGLGININPDSDKLIVFLQGGGACFNALTCAMNPTAWGEADLGTPAGVLSRTDENNPFKDWNLVFIPYCTGDVFSGTKASGGYNDEPMQGYTNIGEYLARIVPTFPNVKQVVLSGASAGGFGASWNWMRTQDAFGDIPVHLLDDSGPPMGEDYLSTCMQQRLGELWGWEKSIHPACKECDIAGGHVTLPAIELAITRGTNTRTAVLSNDEDSVIKLFFSYGQDDCASWDAFLAPAFPTGKYPEGLAELGDRYKDNARFGLFEVSGSGHTFIGGDFASVMTGGVTLSDWLQAFVDGSDDFVTVTPD